MVMWRADVVCVGRAFPPSSYFLQPMALPKSLFEPRSPLRGTHGDSGSAPGAPGTPGQGAGRAGPGRTAGAQGCMHGGQKGVGRGAGAWGGGVGRRAASWGRIAAAARAAKGRGAREPRAPSLRLTVCGDGEGCCRRLERGCARHRAVRHTRRCARMHAPRQAQGWGGAHPGEWIEKPRS